MSSRINNGVDIHSHLLPGIDDGSKSVQESLQMLRMLRQQGVSLVAATPHFEADKESIGRFLERRQQAYEKLASQLPADSPRICLGAEVLYYEGISRMKGLEKLCIQGSDLLLLEMPLSKWSEHMIREILHMTGSGNFRIVIAHVERSLPNQKMQTIDAFVENGILIQSNASCFLHLLSRNRALAMLQRNRLHLIGSDCHSLTSRPPRMGEAYAAISRKFGPGFVRQMNDFASDLFQYSPGV